MKYFTLVTLSLFVMVLCTADKNPYLVSTESGVKITSQSLNDGDTVSIFSTESLTIVLNVMEHIEYFALRTPANRLWSGGDTVINASQFNREPFTFRFSFYDTGLQVISVMALRTTGDSIEQEIRVYARSPLYQAAITAGLGDTVLLSTTAVRDDALYVWDFRDGTVVKNNAGHASYIVKTPLAGGVGELYVTDRFYRSPSAFFVITSRGGAGPRISALSDSLHGDTVFAGDVNFTFSVAVTSIVSIIAATINGVPFDRAAKDNSGAFVLTKLFGGLDTQNGPVRAAVSITDNAGAIAEQTFWIVYSSTVPRSDRPVLRVLFPLTDSAITSTRSFTIKGYAANRTGFDSLSLFLQVGDLLNPQYQRLTADSTWQWTFDLTPGWNSIAVAAFEDTSRRGDTLARVRLSVMYAPGAPDTVAPRLIALMGNGMPLSDGMITAAPLLTVRAEIMDNGALALVSINNAPATVDSAAGWFSADVALTHRLAGTAVRVHAIDSAGNNLDTAATVYLDRTPVYTQVPLTDRIPADSLFSASIGVADPDGDSVSLTVVIRRPRGDSLMQLDDARSIAWRPAAADTGWRTIVVRAWDGYMTADTSFAVYVSPASAKSVPVRFLTKLTDLPDSLVGAHDTLRLVLRVDPIGGISPIRFGARIIDGPILLDASDSAVVVWAPAAGDTGVRLLELTVRDSLGSADTIQALVAVVPAPRVSLQVTVSPAGSARVSRTIDGAENNGPYPAGTTVSLKALPAVGYRIGSWSGAVTRTADSSEVLVRMDSSQSVGVLLTIAPPAITSQPRDTAVDDGRTAFFSVTATGAASYQWSRGTVAIPGAVASSFTTPPVVFAVDSGALFQCAIIGPGGTVTSSAAVLSVRKVAPVVIVQPGSHTVFDGDSAMFGVAATGTLPLSYQWFRNDTAIVGATVHVLTIMVVDTILNGSLYSCLVSNSAGNTTSTHATLTVVGPPGIPTIKDDPLPVTVTAGGTAVFTVKAVGARPISYQWQVVASGVAANVAGATGSKYTISPVMLTQNGQVYQCVVTNSSGSVTSGAALLTVR